MHSLQNKAFHQSLNDFLIILSLDCCKIIEGVIYSLVTFCKTLTTSLLLAWCAFIAFSWTFPITASAHNAAEIMAIPGLKKGENAFIMEMEFSTTYNLTFALSKHSINDVHEHH